jgi:hypothetical protein
MPITPPTRPFTPTPDQQKIIKEGVAELMNLQKEWASGKRSNARKMRPGKADAPLGIEED